MKFVSIQYQLFFTLMDGDPFAFSPDTVDHGSSKDKKTSTFLKHILLCLSACYNNDSHLFLITTQFEIQNNINQPFKANTF